MPRGRIARPLEDRVWEKVDPTGFCWLWTGRPHCDGAYGRITLPGGRRQLAHRTVWELLMGPIPEGMTLDHLCRNTSCVNPDHLEIVTNAENVSRMRKEVARLERYAAAA